jgi:conjugative relaxase-like TrwC/TraI family protein
MGGGESPGVWYENAAARGFGVRGEVIKDDIERFFDGYHPKTGEALAQNHGKADRRAAIDLCLSVPKDVSALWAVSDANERRLIEAAFDRAVDETLRYVSDEFGQTRRGQGGYEREHVDLLVAKFVHRQSRSQDPQLHGHCLALNVARRADGSYGTIDLGPLLQAKKMIGAYFRSALANELGITLEPDHKFSFRVRGVPEKLSEHWSSRANEIEAEARARGVGGGAAKAYVALETRRAKDERPLAEVKEEWRETARQHGFDVRHVEQIFVGGRPRVALTPDRVVETIDQALKVAVEQLTSQHAHFTRADLTRAVLIATAPDGIAPREVLKRVEEALGHERFIALGDRRFTTKEIDHGIEGAALEAAQRLGEKHPSRVVSERRVEKAIRAEPRRNDCQKEAVRMVCQGADLTLIQGAPGSGKSALFAVACHAIEKDGGNVIGLTPSNRVARELEQSSGVKSSTIDRFLFDRERTALDAAKHHAKMLVRTAFGLHTWKQPKLNVNRRTTLIIDECGMADSDKHSRALRHAEKAGCRVVLVGDHRQLPAIGPGGLFRELWERAHGDQKTVLTDIVRQREV